MTVSSPADPQGYVTLTVPLNEPTAWTASNSCGATGPSAALVAILSCGDVIRSPSLGSATPAARGTLTSTSVLAGTSAAAGKMSCSPTHSPATKSPAGSDSTENPAPDRPVKRGKVSVTLSSSALLSFIANSNRTYSSAGAPAIAAESNASDADVRLPPMFTLGDDRIDVGGTGPAGESVLSVSRGSFGVKSSSGTMKPPTSIDISVIADTALATRNSIRRCDARQMPYARNPSGCTMRLGPTKSRLGFVKPGRPMNTLEPASIAISAL
eukprot:923620-Rhodomonas_salina.2